MWVLKTNINWIVPAYEFLWKIKDGIDRSQQRANKCPEYMWTSSILCKNHGMHFMKKLTRNIILDLFNIFNHYVIPMLVLYHFVVGLL